MARLRPLLGAISKKKVISADNFFLENEIEIRWFGPGADSSELRAVHSLTHSQRHFSPRISYTCPVCDSRIWYSVNTSALRKHPDLLFLNVLHGLPKSGQVFDQSFFLNHELAV